MDRYKKWGVIAVIGIFFKNRGYCIISDSKPQTKSSFLSTTIQPIARAVNLNNEVAKSILKNVYSYYVGGGGG